MSTLIIVFLISDCFDYFWVKAIFQFCICVLPEVSFKILTMCYLWARLRFLTAIIKVEAAAATLAWLTVSYVPGPLLRATFAFLSLTIMFKIRVLPPFHNWKTWCSQKLSNYMARLESEPKPESKLCNIQISSIILEREILSEKYKLLISVGESHGIFWR